MPDYTAAAMEKQRRALPGLQRRLAAIDPSGWTVAEQVDYHVVRAEMNGLDFDHRVLQPWARNPAFYVTVFDCSVICRHDYPQLALWATNMASALPTGNADRLRPPCKACNTLYKVNKVYSVTDEPLKQPFILLHFDSDRF